MTELSTYLFGGTFIAYVLSTFLYIGRITLRRRNQKHFEIADRFGALGFKAAATGVALHAGAIAARWIGSGQVPMSNMFEYMSFLGWSIMLFFIIISVWYKLPALGAFVAPIGVIIVAYASVFPTDVRPLVPVLQSYWLPLHVSTAALGEGAFAVGFGAALMYLLRMRSEQKDAWEDRVLESIFFFTVVLVAFIMVAMAFNWTGYSADLTNAGSGAARLNYNKPPLVGPFGSARGEAQWLGMDLPLMVAPEWMQGVNAGRKLNTVIWSFGSGLLLYGLIRLFLRRSIVEVATRGVAGMNPKTLDEVSYRSIAVGFPIFTLGAIVFAMIWAQKAWGAYWQWDPKETWALISWLFYSGYLHMRIVRGWEGRPAAWVAVIGFMVILFTLVGVNLLISGLHSYA